MHKYYDRMELYMEKIIEFLMNEMSQNERAAKRNATKISKYDDIKSEFEYWIDHNDYPCDAIEIEGYTAKKISEIASFMNVVGVYNFMVTLRDNKDFALQTIKDGFPRK